MQTEIWTAQANKSDVTVEQQMIIATQQDLITLLGLRCMNTIKTYNLEKRLWQVSVTDVAEEFC